MANLARGLSYLIAAQFQSLGLLGAAWWIGDWLNHNHPARISWFALTFPVGVLAVAHTFYMVVRHAFAEAKRAEDRAAERARNSKNTGS